MTGHPNQLRMCHVRVHELKTLPEFYWAVITGQKRFEIRLNDRDFQVGDRLLLREWKQEDQCYTGNAVSRDITYITNYQQKEGYVVLGLR
ncbi:MAG TPA: ASCH/PUA domain-containing protein [Nitrososphaera sp.]|nr:ASCH/PUA domain-containing protein [Nitrososphaera sp.]